MTVNISDIKSKLVTALFSNNATYSSGGFPDEGTAHNIAASWTINQSFPSFALIGPRSISELDTTLPCLDIELSEEEINWLNLN